MKVLSNCSRMLQANISRNSSLDIFARICFPRYSHITIIVLFVLERRIQLASATPIVGLMFRDCSLLISSSHTSLSVLQLRPSHRRVVGLLDDRVELIQGVCVQCFTATEPEGCLPFRLHAGLVFHNHS